MLVDGPLYLFLPVQRPIDPETGDAQSGARRTTGRCRITVLVRTTATGASPAGQLQTRFGEPHIRNPT